MNNVAEKLIAKALSQSFVVIVLLCVVGGLVYVGLVQREDKIQAYAELIDCLKTSKKND